MQVGSIRENVIVALLMYKFGGENVETEPVKAITNKDVWWDNVKNLC
jgi:hypothetical protein